MINTLSSNYTPNVPLANQQINNTQPPILANFQDISELIEVNHIPFNTPDTFGKHNFVTYYNQVETPIPKNNEIILFSKNGDTGTQLFYTYPNSNTVNTLTSSNSTGGNPANTGGRMLTSPGCVGGYQYLAGGILMVIGYYYWSVTSTPTTITQSFIFNNTGVCPPFTQSVFYLSVCPYSVVFPSISGPIPIPVQSSGTMYPQVESLTNFNVTTYNAQYTSSFRFIALGV